MNSHFLCIIALFCFFLTGCKKWLDERQNDNVAVPTRIEDLQALLDDSKNLNEFTTPSMLEASADDYFLLQQDYNVLAGANSLIAPYKWGTDPFSYNNDWKHCYYPVYVANLCLQQIEKIQRTDFNASAWDNVKGSALFLRAYFFLELAWTYSKAFDISTSNEDLGIVLRLSPDIGEKSERASVKQTYDQIISDATAAASILPDRSIHCLRPSKCAAFGLLARTYLSMRDYDKALNSAILALKIYDKLIDYNQDSDIIGDFSLEKPPFKKFNKETVFYSTMNTIYATYLPLYGKIDSSLINSYDSLDFRRKSFFNSSGIYYSFKGTYTNSIQEEFSGIGTDELILIRAECLARIGGSDRKGDKNAALQDLNRLLINRYKKNGFTQVSAISAAEALKIILKERRKELLMRGLRWADLKRYNKEGANLTLQRKVNGETLSLLPNDNRYAQPIPNEIILLTGISQNPR